jgi:hypothetical protein
MYAVVKMSLKKKKTSILIHHLTTLNRKYRQSTANEMIPARKGMNAHAQYFEAKDELILSILKAFSQ